MFKTGDSFTVGRNRYRVTGMLAEGAVRAICTAHYVAPSTALNMGGRWFRTTNGATLTFSALELTRAKGEK